MEISEIYKLVFAIREIAKSEVDLTVIALADRILPKDFTLPEEELYRIINEVDSQLEEVSEYPNPIICCTCGNIAGMKKNPIVGLPELKSLKCPQCGEKNYKYVKVTEK